MIWGVPNFWVDTQIATITIIPQTSHEWHVWIILSFTGWLVHQSGQIIATSHDLTPNGGLVREIPLFQGNLGWWNIIIWPDQFVMTRGPVTNPEENAWQISRKLDLNTSWVESWVKFVDLFSVIVYLNMGLNMIKWLLVILFHNFREAMYLKLKHVGTMFLNDVLVSWCFWSTSAGRAPRDPPVGSKRVAVQVRQARPDWEKEDGILLR